jgi:hypothetical protein
VTDPADTGGEPSVEEQALASDLAAERPVPAAGFRGALGRYLADRDPGYGPRPPRLRLIASGLVSGGLVLIALGLLQSTGNL